ncbi:MAG: M81 family metallopeptidase [Verrucomicrobiales bacterium]|nr:M81 family metallopeptidase [Verrucomicrobiales bacterium]
MLPTPDVMRVGIMALLHESNSFVSSPTTLRKFEEDILATGETVRERLGNSRHEVGGFFAHLDSTGIEAVPVFAARAYPAGVIEAETFDTLVNRALNALSDAGPLDGIVAAPHGATVAENYPDADGYWLSRVREMVGDDTPVIATIDPHANLSQQMVAATDALIAYGTNPHIDQEETGEKAAQLLVQTLEGNVKPTQAAAFPDMAITIQSQETSKMPLAGLYRDAEEICSSEAVLSQSIILGFPYSDVQEMGASTLVVANDNPQLAAGLAEEIATRMWQLREDFEPRFTGVEEALDQINLAERTLLLDMGDNVGGGSPADGTHICAALERRSLAPAFVCLCDPESVKIAEVTGVGRTVRLCLGGKTDQSHGDPLVVDCKILSFHEGRFTEPQVRHGGIGEFHQGRTAVVRTAGGVTVMLTSRRVPPFSLEQLTSCGLAPEDFAIITAKGVIAPLAAYGPVCDRVIHVNTPGSTCADMKNLPFRHRRTPLFPFETSAESPFNRVQSAT